MSRAAKLFRLTANALKSEALNNDVPKIRDREVAALLNTPSSTFSEWQGDEKESPQLACLLRMFDYLDRTKVMTLLGDVLAEQKIPIKPALEEAARTQKKKSRKIPKKSASIKVPIPPKDIPQRN